ncbi:MAG: hypothetical protein ABEI31_02550 [Halodesulfurarchaeum sp.]
MTTRIAAIVVVAVVGLAPILVGIGSAGFADDGVDSSTPQGVDMPVLAVGNGNEAAQTNGTNESGNNTTGDGTGEHVSDGKGPSEGVADLPPGTKLAGVIGAQQAEVTVEVSVRTFTHAVAMAKSNATRAEVVANQTQQLQAQLQTLQTRLEQLEARRENGTISKTAYTVQVTHLEARIGALRSLLNRTTAVAASLPPGMLQAHGINQTTLAVLRTRARNLTGQEVAAIARQIAGKGVGNPVGPTVRGPPEGVPGQGPPGNRGPPGVGDEGDETPSNNSSDGHPGGPPEGMGPADDSTRGNSSEEDRGKNGHNENKGKNGPNGDQAGNNGEDTPGNQSEGKSNNHPDENKGLQPNTPENRGQNGSEANAEPEGTPPGHVPTASILESVWETVPTGVQLSI